MKLNKVFLYGKLNNINVSSRLVCEIEVVKGKRPCGNVDSQYKHDIITVISDDVKIIEEAASLKINDMVEISGKLVSKEIPVMTSCSHCGEKNVVTQNMYFVKPRYIGKREEAKSRKEINELLKKRREISNQISIVGKLTTPVQEYVGKDQCDAAVYNIDVDSHDDKKHNFLVRSYGFVSKQDKRFLKKGDFVFVDGALQSMKSKHKAHCPHCDKDYKWSSFSLEIVPYNTEFFKSPE